MAVTIKQLGAGQLGASANVDGLYSAVASGKAQIVKNIRFTNTSTSAAVTLNLLLHAQSAYRQISPVNLVLPLGSVYIEDTEITLEATNKFKATTGATGGPVDWVISGVEREQS